MAAAINPVAITPTHKPSNVRALIFGFLLGLVGLGMASAFMFYMVGEVLHIRDSLNTPCVNTHRLSENCYLEGLVKSTAPSASDNMRTIVNVIFPSVDQKSYPITMDNTNPIPKVGQMIRAFGNNQALQADFQNPNQVHYQVSWASEIIFIITLGVIFFAVGYYICRGI